MDLAHCKLALIFGGTFDPPHLAHVLLPQHVARVLGADAIAYVPAARPPHKLRQAHTPAPHRLAMLQLALAEHPNTVILTDELDRAEAHPEQPSYTVDTLVALRKRLGPDVSLRLLLGADQVRIFDSWHRAQDIVKLAEPVVMLRPPETRDSLLAMFPSESARQIWASRLVDVPPMDISATEIRRRAALGLPLTGLVHPQVAAYIVAHKLYQSS